MKKFLYLAAVMIVAACTLSGCGGDDEPKVKTTATATYSLSFSQDLLDACNVFITYKAENGRNVMEAINSTWWTKTVISDKFPADFGVMYQFSTKSDAELVLLQPCYQQGRKLFQQGDHTESYWTGSRQGREHAQQV